MILNIVLIVVGVWVFFAVVLPIVVFRRQGLGDRGLSKKTKVVARKLRGRSRERTLRNVYDYVVRNYVGSEKKYLLVLYWKIFYKRADELLGRSEFLPCHIQNLILEKLLVASGHFKVEDIKRRLEFTRFGTIHQYLIVRVGEDRYKIDLFFRIFEKMKESVRIINNV